MQYHSAGDQHFETRSHCQQLADDWSCITYLLEIIEYQQQLFVVQVRDETLHGRGVGWGVDVQCLNDTHRHLSRVTHSG